MVLDETDRLLLCDHCRVKLYLSSDRFFSYLMQPSIYAPQEVVYAPYWRVKGMLFGCEGHEIVHKVVDASFFAGALKELPISLGYRSQALHLRFVLAVTPGRFLPTTLPLDRVSEVVQRGVPMTNSETPPPVRFYQTFLGETVSTIHAPFYLQGNTLYDAILERPVCRLNVDGLAMLKTAVPAPEDRLRFLATLCPYCGWDLQGDKDTHVLLCANCHSAWQAAQTALERVVFEVYPGGGSECVFLPFWRIKVAVEGLSPRSYADLVRLANLPKAIKSAWEEQDCFLWSPAFKIRPRAFLQAARAMTLAQPQGARGDTLPKGQVYPVTFPSSEAVEAIKIILAHIAVAKRGVFPLLSELRVGSPEYVLAYVPFTVHANELVQGQCHFSIDRSTVQFGRKL